jgi:hypothetical protein
MSGDPQFDYDHVATVLANCVGGLGLSGRALRELRQFAATASFSGPYREYLARVIAEKMEETKDETRKDA